MLSVVVDILVMHCGSDSADQSKVSLVQYSNLINKRPVNIAQFRLTMSFSLRFLNYYHYHFICCCRLYAYLQCTSLCKSNNKIEFFSLQVMLIVLHQLLTLKGCMTWNGRIAKEPGHDRIYLGYKYIVKCRPTCSVTFISKHLKLHVFMDLFFSELVTIISDLTLPFSRDVNPCPCPCP